VIFCFREDYLAEFEGLRKQIRPIMQNRMRVHPMRATTAITAICEAGREHVNRDIAERIVRFISGLSDEETVSDECYVEPTLLSLVCRELNERRLSRGDKLISAELIQNEHTHQIIETYYAQCFRGVSPRLKHVIEDRLLTRSGYRDSCSVEELIEQSGVEESQIEELVVRRLLRYDVRHGVRRAELAHDVLTQVAKRSRDTRQANARAEEANRMAEASKAEAARLRAMHAEARHFWGVALSEKALRAFESKATTEGILFADHALARIDPSRARAEYLGALGYRLSVLQPGVSPQLDGGVWCLKFAPTSDLVVLGTTEGLCFWNFQDGTLRKSPHRSDSEIIQVDYSPDGRFFADRSLSGLMRLWNVADGSRIEMPSWARLHFSTFAFSPTSRYVATASPDGMIKIWDLHDRQELASERFQRPSAHSLAWTASGGFLLSFADASSYRWSGARFEKREDLPLGAARTHSVRASPDFRRLIAIARDRLVLSYDVVEQPGKSLLLERRGSVIGQNHDFKAPAFSADAELFALGVGTWVELHDTASGQLLARLTTEQEMIVANDYSRDGRWLAAGTGEGHACCWKLPLADWERQANLDEQYLGRRLDGIQLK
jgi:hypothetical protein